MSVSSPSFAKSKPCSCRGDGSNCGCGCGTAASSIAPGGFARPRFFAGQLLTDEDLQATLDYFVEKNRLHNRHFFGEGVVCGLQVQRHPCSEQRRKVIVHAGHALDACGNDILVSADQELDILTMVRKLLARRRDENACADPCGSSVEAPQDSTDQPTSRFQLYLNYSESKTDLITPYQVDGHCGESCEATRIREGYRFELRCPSEEPKQDDMRSRLDAFAASLPGYKQLQTDTLFGVSALEMAERVLVQFESLVKSSPVVTLPDLKHAVEGLRDAIKSLPKLPTVASEYEVVLAAHGFLTMAFRTLYIPADPIDDTTKNLLKTWQKKLGSVLDILQNAKLSPEDGVEPVPTSVIVDLAKRNTELADAIETGEDGRTIDGKAKIVGELIDPPTLTFMVNRLDDINDVLRGFVASGAVVIDTELRAAMRTVQLSEFNVNLLNLDTLKDLRKQVDIVGRAVAEISKQQLCDVLLPPCPSVSDTAVLLADVFVKGCEVVDVCSLSRRMVITGPSLRYWLSDFSAILNPLRDSCCPSPAVIQQAKSAELGRRENNIITWKNIAANQTFLPDLKQRIGDARVWRDSLETPRIGGSPNEVELRQVELSQVAVEPPSLKLFEIFGQEDPSAYKQLTSQSLNFALSKLASRPSSDIRRVLERSDNLETQAEIKRYAQQQAETAAKNVKAGIAESIKAVDEAVTAERQGRMTAISEEATVRDQKIAAAIAQEATVRDQAISAEATVRDQKITAAIAQEVTARDQAISAEATVRDQKITAAIAQEVTARDQAISAEATVRDQKITAAIAQEVTARDQAISAEATVRDQKITAAIAQEVTARDQAISAEATVRDQKITAAIAQEVTARDQAISAEATVRDQKITAAIAQEVIDRDAAIAAAIPHA